LNNVQFDSMVFQERNETCGMELECSGQNLAEKSGTDRDLKWDEICSVLFRFLNWYGMFRPFPTKRNEIDNLASGNTHDLNTDFFRTASWSFVTCTVVLCHGMDFIIIILFRSLLPWYVLQKFKKKCRKHEYLCAP
jgi:hypothetical protein